MSAQLKSWASILGGIVEGNCVAARQVAAMSEAELAARITKADGEHQSMLRESPEYACTSLTDFLAVKLQIAAENGIAKEARDGIAEDEIKAGLRTRRDQDDGDLGFGIPSLGDGIGAAFAGSDVLVIPPGEKQDLYSGLLWIAKVQGFGIEWADQAYKKKFGVLPKALVKIARRSDAAHGWERLLRASNAKASKSDNPRKSNAEALDDDNIVF